MTIEKTGYPGYFLIVQDFTTEAHHMGVSVGPGRGSAAGSAVAYCTGITNVDQLWKLANISVALSAIPNLIALLFLSGVFIKLMRDYFSEQRKFDTELIDRTRNYIKIS